MPITRNGTERPREPLLQLYIEFGYLMCRIGRRLWSRRASAGGVNLEIRPFNYLNSNSRMGGHCMVGSLTGVVASKRVTEAPKGALMAIGNRQQSVMV